MENQDIVTRVKQAVQNLEFDVVDRNEYMNKRDRYVYDSHTTNQTGLWENLKIKDGFDQTLYNFLGRVVDIHTAQLMGRGFNIYSYYNKEDLSAVDQTAEDGGEQMEAAKLRNKKRKASADTRKKLVDAIIRDNGGIGIFKQGARIGSAYGTTVFKAWWDDADKKYRISLLESPQNYRAGWSDSNFRERDFDAYVYQISASKANQLYADKLPDGEEFQTSQLGDPFGQSDIGTDVSNRTLTSGDPVPATSRDMVTVLDFTGYLDGYAGEGGKLKEAKPGDETRISLLVVGGHVCQIMTDEDLLPKYYMVRNRENPRRSWGESDLPDSALEINATYMERMSDYITLVNKTLFPLIQAKGFDVSGIPKKKQREMSVVAMTQDQSLEAVDLPTAFGFEYNKLIEELKDAFVKVTGIGRVLFDDPTINPSSNQALITTLKGVIDIVEDKQTRWEPALREMFTDALKVVARKVPEAKEAIETEEDWYLMIEWPSVLRREDATYQQMWLNQFNAGAVSLDTYLEKIGIPDTSEEIDRLRDNLADPVPAAVLSRQLGLLVQQLLAPPGQPQPKVNVSLRGDLTPNQEANLATQQGFNDGPFAPTAGPQGNQGLIAQENVDNANYLSGDPFQGGGPIQRGPDGQPVETGQQSPNPQLTPDQNTGQTASQPGSGATSVSPEGAINQMNQRNGA